MTEREALKLALEAFGEIEWSNDSQWQSDRAAYAMLAIKEALANVATNDTSQERVDKTSEIVHEAQRTWVGLTDDEIDAVTDQQWGKKSEPIYAAHRAYARAIEAKFKEKNT